MKLAKIMKKWLETTNHHIPFNDGEKKGGTKETAPFNSIETIKYITELMQPSWQ